MKTISRTRGMNGIRLDSDPSALSALCNKLLVECRANPAPFENAIEFAIAKKRSDFASELLNRALVFFPRNRALVKIARRIEKEYSQQFYDATDAQSYSSGYVILRRLCRQYSFDSVIDIGAGSGTWLRAAQRCGARQLVGVEGDWMRRVNKQSGAKYVYQDLNRRIAFQGQFDLAVCVEVAEHLHPSRSKTLVQDLCNHSAVVIFGGALPRQKGHGHINCRPHSYWRNLFASENYTCLDMFRPTTWLNKRVAPWYAQNTFLYVSAKRRDCFCDVAEASLIDVYHPWLTSSEVLWDIYLGTADPKSPPIFHRGKQRKS